METASKRPPTLCGKPSEFVFEGISQMHPEIDAKRTLIIGDRLGAMKSWQTGSVFNHRRLNFRLDSDIRLGKLCGLKTLLVGTGINTMEDVEKIRDDHLAPEFYARDLKRFAEESKLMK